MNRDERVKRLVAHAYKNSPAFARRLDDAALLPEDIQSFKELEKLAVLPKDQVVGIQQADPPFGGMLAVPMSEVRHIFFSPGPIYEPDAGDDSTGVEMAQALAREAGFTADDIVLNSLSYHLVPAGLLADMALSEMGCTVMPAGIGNSELQLKLLADLSVTAYIGTPSFLMHLIEKAEGMGLDFRKTFKLTKAIVSAEPLSASMRDTLVNKYGIALTNAYGTAEFGFLAFNGGEGMAMKLLAEPIIEVLDPETGKPVPNGTAGEVVVTNYDEAYPLLRYGTGDMAVYIDPEEGQGAQANRQIILVGRRGEAVKVRGMFVHPNQVRFAVGQVAQMTGVVIDGLQGIVTREGIRDLLTLHLAIGQEPPATLAEMVKGAVQQAARVKIDAVEFVAAGSISADAPGMVDQRSWD